MQTLSTTEVARSIGAVVLDVQRQPITITKRGTPVAVVVSAAEWQELLEAAGAAEPLGAAVARLRPAPIHG